MRALMLFAVAIAPIAVVAAFASPRGDELVARQTTRPGDPKFCEKAVPAPADAEVAARHEKFADAFLVKKDLALAFTYIAPEYVNHNPVAQNGASWAYNFLKGVWGNQRITVIRTLYRNGTSWLNYSGGAGGGIIDRYRWEGGCIVEHWDSGEKWPATP